jgi:hypothetical protein
MCQKNRGRGLAALALALVLTIASPAVANAAQRTGPVGLWGWMESLWAQGLGQLWRSESPVPSRGGKTPAVQTKEGACIDPNGRCAHLFTGGQAPVCSRLGDQEECVDPI